MSLDFQPYERNVQQGMVDGQYASGAFTMVAAGPPRLQNLGLGALNDAVNAAITTPIGLVQNMSLSHSRAFNRIFELGSERSYHISGRTNGQMCTNDRALNFSYIKKRESLESSS